MASPARAYAPLWLKVLVIVMGLLIVAGFVVIAAEIARRMSTPNAARSPAAASGFSERIALPAGARVVSVTTAGERADRPRRDAGAAPPSPTSSTRATARIVGAVEFAPGSGGEELRSCSTTSSPPLFFDQPRATSIAPKFYDAVLAPLLACRGSIAASGPSAMVSARHVDGAPCTPLGLSQRQRRVRQPPLTGASARRAAPRCARFRCRQRLANGGGGDGPPGIREIYSPDYYAAFVRDPDGNRLEAVTRRPEEQT